MHASGEFIDGGNGLFGKVSENRCPLFGQVNFAGFDIPVPQRQPRAVERKIQALLGDGKIHGAYHHALGHHVEAFHQGADFVAAPGVDLLAEDFPDGLLGQALQALERTDQVHGEKPPQHDRQRHDGER